MVRKPPHCHCHVSYHPQTKNKNTQQNCWVLRPWSNVLDLQRKMKPDSTELAKETPKMHIQKSISLAIFHQKSNGIDFSRTLFNKMQSSYYILRFFSGSGNKISWLFGEKTTSSKVAKREGDIMQLLHLF